MSWLTISLGFLIIAAASLSVVYYQRANEREQLRVDLYSARSKLSSVDTSTLAYQQEKLEVDLNRTYRDYEADKAKFVQSIENIAVGNVLYSTARANSVNITDMSSSDVTSAVIEGAPCAVLSLNAKVVGEANNLVAFIAQLNDDLINAVVKSVNIAIPTSDSDSIASADIQMVIYKYEE
jgi:hypothetical protein